MNYLTLFPQVTISPVVDTYLNEANTNSATTVYIQIQIILLLSWALEEMLTVCFYQTISRLLESRSLNTTSKIALKAEHIRKKVSKRIHSAARCDLSLLCNALFLIKSHRT